MTPTEIRHLAATVGIGSLDQGGRQTPNGTVLAEAHDALRAYADLLQQREQQTCATCRYASLPSNFWFGRRCNLDGTILNRDGSENVAADASEYQMVPLLGKDGQPFTCAGWTATDDQAGGR